MKQHIYNILSILATIACFFPLLIVIFKRLWRSLPFLLFSCYWALGGMVNLIDIIPGMSSGQLETITVLYNMFDVPIVLSIIHFTTNSVGIRKFTRFVTPAFLGVELINFIIRGLNYDAAKYMLATGLVLVLAALSWEIWNYVQRLEHSELEKAKVFLHASLLFVYGTFVIIYVFDYYVNNRSSIDNFLIYYISCLIATVISAVGFFSKGARSYYRDAGVRSGRGEVQELESVMD